MVRVVRHHDPPPGSDTTRPSDALECPNCKAITWVWADADSASCKRCSLKFFSRAGVWVLRGALPRKIKPANPEG